MNTSTEQILQCNQSEPLADASGKMVDLMNEDDLAHARRCIHMLLYITEKKVSMIIRYRLYYVCDS